MSWVAIAAVAVLFLLVPFLAVLRMRQQRLRRLAKTQAPSRMPHAPTTDVATLARQGRTMEAIRALRSQHRHIDLVQAKRIVDELAAGKSPTILAKQEPIIDVRDEDITREIRENRLMNAIALYREKNGVGLAEARTAVEALRHRMHAS